MKRPEKSGRLSTSPREALGGSRPFSSCTNFMRRCGLRTYPGLSRRVTCAPTPSVQHTRGHSQQRHPARHTYQRHHWTSQQGQLEGPTSRTYHQRKNSVDLVSVPEQHIVGFRVQLILTDEHKLHHVFGQMLWQGGKLHRWWQSQRQLQLIHAHFGGVNTCDGRNPTSGLSAATLRSFLRHTHGAAGNCTHRTRCA